MQLLVQRTLGDIVLGRWLPATAGIGDTDWFECEGYFDCFWCFQLSFSTRYFLGLPHASSMLVRTFRGARRAVAADFSP